MDTLYNLSYIWLFIISVPIGIFAIVFGGTMFLSIPTFQLFFPEMTMGAIIGNIKVGSIIRNIGATWVLRKQIKIKLILPILILFCIGAVIGALMISKVSQSFLLPAIIAAIIISELAKKISKYIPKSLFYIIVFFIGIFGGILGAGIILFIIALLRMKISEDKHIHQVRALSLFAELLLSITAVIVFYFTNQLTFHIWIIWSAGAIIGGYIGGKIIHHTGNLTPKTQKIFLRASFTFALIIAIIKII